MGKNGEMTEEELDKEIKRIMKAWNRLHPEDELVWISLPKNDMEERKRTIASMYRIFCGDVWG